MDTELQKSISNIFLHKLESTHNSSLKIVSLLGFPILMCVFLLTQSYDTNIRESFQLFSLPPIPSCNLVNNMACEYCLPDVTQSLILHLPVNTWLTLPSSPLSCCNSLPNPFFTLYQEWTLQSTLNKTLYTDIS